MLRARRLSRKSWYVNQLCGTKTGNKKKSKDSNYRCGPVEKLHWFVDRRTKDPDDREDREIWKILVVDVQASSK